MRGLRLATVNITVLDAVLLVLISARGGLAFVGLALQRWSGLPSLKRGGPYPDGGAVGGALRSSPSAHLSRLSREAPVMSLELIPVKRHTNHFLSSGTAPGRNYLVSHPETQGKTGGRSDLLVVVLLNTESDANSRILLGHLWSRASLRLCADGGANRLYDSLEPSERVKFIPEVIIGDLDSIRPEVSSFYEDLGSEVIREQNQDHNDFEKCLMEAERRLGRAEEAQVGRQWRAVGASKQHESKVAVRTGSSAVAIADTIEADTLGSGSSRLTQCPATVVGLGAFGGRFDHEMAAMSLLHEYTSRFNRLVLLGEGNIAFLLDPKRRHIMTPDKRFEGPTCGLIPIGGPCEAVTTQGLKWNLRQGQLKFGVLVSSSNSIEGSKVEVETDAPLVWTVEFHAGDWARVNAGLP